MLPAEGLADCLVLLVEVLWVGAARVLTTGTAAVMLRGVGSEQYIVMAESG